MMILNSGNMARVGAIPMFRSANANVPPARADGAVTSDLGLALLRKIAGV